MSTGTSKAFTSSMLPGTDNHSKITPRYNSRRLVVDANLKSSWAPINKLNGAFGLNGGDCSIHIFWDHITPVEHAAGHVLPVSRITFHHLVGWLKTGICNLCNTELLMVGLLCRYDRSIGYQWEVNPGIWNQVCLKLCEINIESSIKSKRCRDG